MTTETGIPARALKAHLALNVGDVEASIAFYRSMFGIEPSKVRAGYAKFDVENPPLNFTLNEHPVSARGALSHLGIQVGSTDEVLAVRARWAAAGLAPVDETKTDCCYALQDKAWVHDPDGNSWEVFVVLEDNLPERADRAACCTPGVEPLARPTETRAAETPVETGCGCAPSPLTIGR